MQIKINKPLVIIFILGFINSVFFMYGHKLVEDSFQLIERGYLLTQGYFVPFGPRSTHTNMIYGSFITLVSGLGISLTSSPIGIMIVIFFSQIIAFLCLAKTQFLNLKNNRKFILIYLFLFWCSPWRSSEAFIWNVSLLFFTSSLFICSLDLLRRKKEFLGTLLHGLSYILSFQVHNSVIIFAPISLYFLYKKEIKFNIKSFFLCVFIFILMLSPTAYMLYNHPEILEYNTSSKAYLFANLFGVGEFIKGVAYWLRYPSLYFGSTTLALPKISFESRSLFGQVWFAIKWALAISSVLSVLYMNIKGYKKLPSFLKELIRVAFISLVFISAMSPVPFNFWHLYLIYPFTIIPVAFYMSEHFQKKPIYWCLGGYFFLYSVISASYSYKHDFSFDRDKSYSERVLKNKDGLIEKYKDISIKLID